MFPPTTASDKGPYVSYRLSGPAGWIATKRQSDPAKTSSISFDLTADADVYIMFTRQPSVPPWISDAGFTDTGVTGRWRDKREHVQLSKVRKISIGPLRQNSLQS